MQIQDLQFGKKYKFKTKKGASYTATFVGREGSKESDRQRIYGQVQNQSLGVVIQQTA